MCRCQLYLHSPAIPINEDRLPWITSCIIDQEVFSLEFRISSIKINLVIIFFMLKKIFIGIGAFLLIMTLILVLIPSTRNSVSWRLDQAVIRVRSLIAPPQDVSFEPNQTSDFNLDATLTALAPSATPPATPTQQNTAIPTQTPTPHPRRFQQRQISMGENISRSIIISTIALPPTWRWRCLTGGGMEISPM